MKHKELCAVAVKWLKRPTSDGSHGCDFALNAQRAGFREYGVDAIGFRARGDFSNGSTVIRVEISRDDFLADIKTLHRVGAKSCGNWRYMMCQEGVITPEELPPGWGLLHVDRRRMIKPVIGAVAAIDGQYEMRAQLNTWRLSSDVEREHWLMVKLLSRLGDPDDLTRKLRDAANEQLGLEKLVQKQDAKIAQLTMKLDLALHGVAEPLNTDQNAVHKNL